MSSQPITLADILAARQSIDGMINRTPIVPSPSLSAISGNDVVLKMETMQPIGVFKLRGAANALANLTDDERRRGVVCYSTGNHGRGVASAARAHGVKAIICLSHLVPDVKVNAIKALGAEVRRIGNSQDDAEVEVDRLVREDGMINLPPFDHPHVIAGQGTIGLELFEDRPDLQNIVVPLSGGGLAAGIAIAAKAIRPSVRIIAISMDRGAAMAASLEAGKPVEVEEFHSLADSLGGGIGQSNHWTLELCRDLIDDIVLLSEHEIYRGMQHLYREDRIVAEGGGAVGPAALLAGKIRLEGPSAMIISGRNVDMDMFTSIINSQPVQLGDLTVAA